MRRPTAEPHDVCASVNRLLCRNIASGKFVTFCYAVVDTATADGRATPTRDTTRPSSCTPTATSIGCAPTGLVLGVAADWTYTTGTARFGPGDRLVCFTDGITEAGRPADEEFGEDRLIDDDAADRPDRPSRLARAIAGAVDAWTGGAPQDDATLIVVRCTEEVGQSRR